MGQEDNNGVHVDLEIPTEVSKHIAIQKIRHNMKDKREYINKVLLKDMAEGGLRFNDHAQETK